MADDDKKDIVDSNSVSVKGEKDSKVVSQPRKGFLSRIWNGIFRRRSDDFEKKLQYLSKEEASVHARTKKRAETWRKMARNLIVYSVVLEAVAVAYAIMMTRTPDLTWNMRALRVLPVFVVPGVSSVIYSTIASFIRMRERKDQKTLERLRAERKEKIDELKERTNYYRTQQLIQRYDLDPAAKAAAASVLASKLGADSGIKVFVDDTNINTSTVQSSGAEVVRSDGLRKRRPTHARNNSTGSVLAHHQFHEEFNPQDPGLGAPQEEVAEENPTIEMGNHLKRTAVDGGWIARIAAMLVGEDPTQCYALICSNCHMHNGLAKKEDFQYITYYCPHCHALNGPQQSDDTSSDAPKIEGNPSGLNRPLSPHSLNPTTINSGVTEAQALSSSATGAPAVEKT